MWQEPNHDDAGFTDHNEDRGSSICRNGCVSDDMIENGIDSIGIDDEEKFLSILKTIVPTLKELAHSPHNYAYDGITYPGYIVDEYDPAINDVEEDGSEYYNLLLKLYSINKSIQERLLVIFSNIQHHLKKIREQQVASIPNHRVIFPPCP